MKWIVIFLVLVNLGLFAYFELSEANQAATQIRPPPIQPDKIKLLTPQEIESLPKKEPVPTQPSDAPDQAALSATSTLAATPALDCYEWGNFSTRNLPRAKNVLTQFSLTGALQKQTSQAAIRYWVYIPKSASAQTAQTKIDELRALNIDDIFVVQEPQWRYAISLGVFKDEQLAAKRLADVKSRGVVSAVKAVRNQEQGQSSFIISNVSADTAAEIAKLKPDFPGSEIKQVTCQ